MGRFSRERDPNQDPQASESIKEWSRSGDEHRFDQDLTPVDSDLDGFGDSGATGFSEAWSDADDEVGTIPEGAEQDKRAQRLRNMDRRFSVPRVLGLVVVLVGIGWLLITQPWVGGDEAAVEQAPSSELLVAPGQPRNYANGAPNAQLNSAWALQDAFVSLSVDGELEAVPPEEIAVPTNLVAAPLLWGGRAHVALMGPGVGNEEFCGVASLFAEDFSVIDVAADGSCGDRFNATGDRLACRGNNIILLEVWPENPDSTELQPDATRVRVRLEQIDEDGSVESRRVSVELGQRFDLDLVELAGVPLETANIGIGGQSGMCDLLDRADVPVQLL